MVECQEVEKRYPDFELKLDSRFPEERIIGILGRNGSGKTTLYKSILGLISLDEGKILIDGKPVDELSVKDKEQIGVVMANAGFSNMLTMKQIQSILASMYSTFSSQKFDDICRRFSLPLDKKTSDFSTGMMAAARFAWALSHESKLLLLDEPTAGLDVVMRDQLLDLVQEYMEVPGRTVLISSHIASDLESVCDSIVLIDNGKILLEEDMDVLDDIYGLIKADSLEGIDPKYIVFSKKMPWGVQAVVKERQYYAENWPDLVVSPASLDDLLITGSRREEE